LIALKNLASSPAPIDARRADDADVQAAASLVERAALLDGIRFELSACSARTKKTKLNSYNSNYEQKILGFL